MMNRRGNGSSGGPSSEKAAVELAPETRKTLQQPLLASEVDKETRLACPSAGEYSRRESEDEDVRVSGVFGSGTQNKRGVGACRSPDGRKGHCRVATVFGAGNSSPALESDLEAPLCLHSSNTCSEDSRTDFLCGEKVAATQSLQEAERLAVSERQTEDCGRERFREYSEWVVRGGCRLSSALWNAEEESEKIAAGSGVSASSMRETERVSGLWNKLKKTAARVRNPVGGMTDADPSWRRVGTRSCVLDPVSISLPSCSLLDGGCISRLASLTGGTRSGTSFSLLKAGSGTPQRARKFRVVEIEGGVCRRLEVQTPELLRMVHLHNSRKELRDMMVGALKLRDLRQVVSPSGGGRPSIEVRRNCVLVNMPYVRCIILYQRVLLLPPSRFFVKGFSVSTPAQPQNEGPNASSGKNLQLSEVGNFDEEGAASSLERQDHQYELLISKLVHLSELKRAGPFEFAALEAVLVHVCDELIAGLAPLKKAADSILEAFHRQPSSTRRLRQISELKRRLGGISERASGVERAIKELLNEEDDMTRLELSRFWHTEEAWENPSKTATAEDAEILLECYEQEVEAIFQVVVRTEDALDDALQLMELHLASTRNAFLKTEIALDVLGAFFGFVAAVAGIFGMNIRSGWEEKTDVFWGVTVAFSLAGATTFALLLCWFRTQKL